KSARQPADKLLRHFEQRHVLPRTSRTLYFELIAVEGVKIDQRPHDQRIHRHPHRPAPVGITAEHAGIRFSGQVLDFVLLTPDMTHKRMLQVIARERAYAMRPEKLVLVEH